MTVRWVLAAMGLAVVWQVASGIAVADGGWAERLGYPADKKVVILHAHDMGLCFESNQATAELLDGEAPVSASAMAPCPWFGHAAGLVAERPGADVGLQLTLNSEWPAYRWKPIDALAGSLTDSEGCLWRSVLQVALSAQADDVASEIRAQMEHARRSGLKPTHLTTHLGALYARPDLTELYLRFAREQWVPAVVVELTPEMAARFASEGFAVPERLGSLLADYPFPKLKDLRILPHVDDPDAKAEAVVAMIDDLPAGLSQIAFAPAVDSPALRALTPAWRRYVNDHQVWSDARVRERLAAGDVVLTNWTEIMQRFDGASR